jgi:hypothetical protein
MSDFPYLLTENTELSDWIPHDGGECPVSESALVHVDIPGLSLCPAAADGFPWNRVKRYRIIRPKQPDWIPHDGGPCPVPRDARVAVRFRDATERSDLLAAQWDWSRATNAKVGYITHYRVLDTEQPTSPNDHYRQGDIECIDAIRAALNDEEWRGYCKGSIIGYVWRERHKGGDEDLIKSQDFLRWAVAGKAEGKR